MSETETEYQPETATTPEDELFLMANAFVECIAQFHDIPIDFNGLVLNILRDPDTHQLQAVVISPVDIDPSGNGEATPRYKVESSKFRVSERPKIVVNH